MTVAAQAETEFGLQACLLIYYAVFTNAVASLVSHFETAPPSNLLSPSENEFPRSRKTASEWVQAKDGHPIATDVYIRWLSPLLGRLDLT